MSNYPEGVSTGPWDEEVCDTCETTHGKHDYCVLDHPEPDPEDEAYWEALHEHQRNYPRSLPPLDEWAVDKILDRADLVRDQKRENDET